MQITAQYFAVFREQAGCSTENLDTESVTAAELYAEVANRHEFLDSVSKCKVAVNDELASWKTSLKEGDVVLFFPPVAGG